MIELILPPGLIQVGLSIALLVQLCCIAVCVIGLVSENDKELRVFLFLALVFVAAFAIIPTWTAMINV